MKFQEYLADLGDARVATLYGVSKRTAESWRLGTRVPKPEKTRQIVDHAHGLLTWDDIYAARRPDLSPAEE